MKDPEAKLHGAIKLSTARFTSPSGREIQRSPAVPDWGIAPAPKMRLPMTAEEQQEAWRKHLAVRRQAKP